MNEKSRSIAEREWEVRRTTILLVEDESFVREVAAEVLRSAGYRVWSAANAMDAIRIYEEYDGRFDLLLTDVMLPGQTGRALANKLRATNSKLRVLLVTGYGELMCAQNDGYECLAKPFTSAELLRRVEAVLQVTTEICSEIGGFHFSEDTSGSLGQTFFV